MQVGPIIWLKNYWIYNKVVWLSFEKLETDGLLEYIQYSLKFYAVS